MGDRNRAVEGELSSFQLPRKMPELYKSQGRIEYELYEWRADNSQKT